MEDSNAIHQTTDSYERQVMAPQPMEISFNNMNCQSEPDTPLGSQKHVEVGKIAPFSQVKTIIVTDYETKHSKAITFKGQRIWTGSNTSSAPPESLGQNQMYAGFDKLTEQASNETFSLLGGSTRTGKDSSQSSLLSLPASLFY